MGITCTRCQGTGFLNIEQVEEDYLARASDSPVDFHEEISKWISANEGHDVSVCDCCGDGENWNGEPGEHGYNEHTFDCM